MCSDKTNSALNEKIIKSVANKRPLWDRRSKAYYNREVVKQLWEEVGAETGISSDVAKYKWRGLRDTFRKELRKRHMGAGNTASSWVYYKNMAFLMDQIIAPESISAIDHESEKDPEDHFLNLDETSSRNESNNLLTPIQLCEANLQDEHYSDDILSFEEARRPNSDVKFLLSRKRKSKEQRSTVVPLDEDDASDYHFLMSLLPYMKAVRRERKMGIRLKIQQIFYDEENESERNSYYSPYTSLSENVASSSQIKHDGTDEDDDDVS